MSDTTTQEPARAASAKSGRRWRWLPHLAGLAGIGLAVYLLLPYQAQEPAPLQPTSTPESYQVKALGEVLPSTDLVTVAAPTGQDVGRIAEIRVGEGDRVAKGDILAVLDTEPLLRADLAQAVANEAVKRVALAARRADLDAAEAQLSAQVDQLEVALEKAQTELDRMTKLRDSGLYEDAALVDLRLDVESARYNLRNTEIQLERNRLRLTNGLRVDEASAQAELESAVAASSRSQADYDKAAIRAPIDGRILALFGRIGQQIGADGFATIADTTQMKVRAEVYESDIARVSVGQAVTVSPRGIAEELSGTVERIGVRISEQSIVSTDPAAIVDARVVEVWIALDEASSATTADLSKLQVVVSFTAAGADHA